MSTEGAPGIEIGRQSIDDSGIVCTQMVLRWCTAGAALLPSCCCPAAALLLPSCCCPAETHLRPPAGGGVTGHLMCQLASVEATFPKCGGVPDPRPERALYWDSGRLYWDSGRTTQNVVVI